MFAFLGSIQIGVSAFTGPTQSAEVEKSKLARIQVAIGKPPIQDMGDDLSEKRMAFFFDETFCDPAAEMAKLRAARQSREPLAYAPGDGSYTGARYIVETIEGEIKNTTPFGRIVRIEAHLTLIEAPVRNLASLASSLARASAPARAGNALLSVFVRT